MTNNRSTDVEIKSHNYEGDDPGGLDSLSMRLPVTDTDALEIIELPVMLAVPGEEIIEQHDEVEAVPYWMFGRPHEQTEVSFERIEDIQEDVVGHFLEEFEEVALSVSGDELENSEGYVVGEAELHFKHLEFWRLSRYRYWELTEPVRRLDYCCRE